MTSRPVVGISCYVESASWGSWNSVRAAVLPDTYLNHLREAGLDPVILPPTADGSVVSRLDGLVLAGGADIESARYGQTPHPTADAPRKDRDDFEFALYRAALAADLPFLGICRGLQVMAVAHGGTLHQHLFDVVGDWKHREIPGTFVEHSATFTTGSKIAEIYSTTAMTVNSSHHQSVDSAGDLLVTGWAEDGTIEVCERAGAKFAVGVQWHPENLNATELFNAFSAACRN